LLEEEIDCKVPSKVFGDSFHVTPESIDVYTVPLTELGIAANMSPSLDDAIEYQLTVWPLGTDAVCCVQLRPESVDV
jgi:hypothetical protein